MSPGLSPVEREKPDLTPGLPVIRMLDRPFPRDMLERMYSLECTAMLGRLVHIHALSIDDAKEVHNTLHEHRLDAA